MVYDLDNRPCAGVSIEVDTRCLSTSDSSGRFLLPDLSRGPHRLSARKSGYETFEGELDFEDETQVLYLRIVSLPQLLSRAEEAVGDGDWRNATELLERAGRMNPNDPAAEFLLSVMEYNRNQDLAAKQRLLRLLSRGTDDVAVYLLLADLYEQRLGRPDLAAEALRQVLDRAQDPSIVKRLIRLTQP
jgi:tetratricopeptide (TPR) repeat protein